MKKLIPFALVGLCVINQTSPMLFFRKTSTKELVPVFQEDMSDGQWSFRGTQKPLLPQLEELEGQDRKEKIKAWCDEFKKNSKKPGMWQKPEEVKKRDIEKVEACLSKNVAQDIRGNLGLEVSNLNDNKTFPIKSDFDFFHRIEDIQKNEWDKWQLEGDDVAGIQVTYKTEDKSDQHRKQSSARIFMHSVNNLRYFVTFNKSPYYKTVKEGYSPTLAHELENSAYHHALQSLQITAEALKRDLHNQSYFQQLWNYTKRQNSWQALVRVENEIALFEDQDAIVSREKKVFDRGEEISEADIIKEMIWRDDIDKAKDGTCFLKKRQYLKPSLTHRQVFARSSMPQTFFEQVKTARE